MPNPASTYLGAMRLAGLSGPSWASWVVCAKVMNGVALDATELDIFKRCTGLDAPPPKPPTELHLVCGRRSGKTRWASAAALCAASRDYSKLLAPGEVAIVSMSAADRPQARTLYQ